MITRNDWLFELERLGNIIKVETEDIMVYSAIQKRREILDMMRSEIKSKTPTVLPCRKPCLAELERSN
jgi:hypothetical protein